MKGCLALIVLFFALAGGEYVALGHTPLAGSIGLPLLSAATVVLALASLWGTLLGIKRRRALGVSPERWSDGDFVGFAGRLTSEDVPLAAPGSGRMSAIYEYSLKQSRTRGDDSVDVTAFHGMGMSGCRVQSGTQSLRLVGFPILSQVPKTILGDSASLARIAEHLLRSEVAAKPQGVAATLRSLADVLGDADGVVRFDQGAHAEFDLGPYRERYASDRAGAVDDLATRLQTEGFFVEETVVAEGAEVTVYGAYRAANRAIDVGSGLQNMERGLALGGAAATSNAELARSAIALALLLGSAVGLHRWILPPLLASRTAERYQGRGVGFDDAIAAALGRSSAGASLVGLAQEDDAPAITLLTRLGADPNTSSGDIRPLQQADRFETVRALLDAGADPNFSGHQGSSPLHQLTERGDLASVRLLIARGARVDPVDDWGNTPLLRAAVYGHVEIGRALLDAGADPNHRAKDGSTALDEARANGQGEFARMLQNGGARETEVTSSTGTALSLGDAPIRLLQSYETALAARDTSTVGILKPDLRGYDWSSTDWNALLGGRPVRFTEVTGYAAADRATARVRGPTADGRPRGLTLGFALARDPAAAAQGPLAPYDGWHIEREWIEWGELQRRR